MAFAAPKGLFITGEGPEGCGKTSQLRRLAEHLRNENIPVIITREPGGTPISEKLRVILKDVASAAMHPRAELLIFAASRAQHVEEVVRPSLERGEIAISDRYTDSSKAIQGYGRGLSHEEIDSLNEYAVAGIWPDITLLFDVPVEIGLQRAGQRNSAAGAEDRLDLESPAFHRRVRDGYLALAKKYPERYIVIDGSRTEDEVWADLLYNVVPIIRERYGK